MGSNSNYFPSWWIIRYHVYYCFETPVHCRGSTSLSEGVACKEVLIAGETGGDGLIAILYALGIGHHAMDCKRNKAAHHSVEGTVNFLGTKFYGGIDLSIALFSVEYRWNSYRIIHFFEGIIGFGILVPLYGFVNDACNRNWRRGFSYLWKIPN